jgi:hypothetical protein
MKHKIIILCGDCGNHIVKIFYDRMTAKKIVCDMCHAEIEIK